MKNFFKNKLLVGLAIAIVVMFMVIAVLFTLIIKKNKEEDASEEQKHRGEEATVEVIDDETVSASDNDKGDFSDWVMPLKLQRILCGATSIAADEDIKMGHNPGEIGSELIKQYMNPTNEETDENDDDCDCSGETYVKIDGCFYNSDSGEVLTYIRKGVGDDIVNNPQYFYIWHIIPNYNEDCGFEVTELERLALNRECMVSPLSGDVYSDNDVWSAFYFDCGPYTDDTIYGVKAKREDGSSITASDLKEWEFFDGSPYGACTADFKFLDFDNDGEIEVLVGRDSLNTYGGMCFDFRPDGMYIIGEGDGTAAHLSYTWYENALWLVYSDITHAGRTTYDLVKLGKNGKVEDRFGLYAYANGDDYEDYDNYEYTYRDEQITQEEFEALKTEIFMKNNLMLEEYENSITSDSGDASPELAAMKAAYRDVVQDYYNEHKEYESEYSKLHFSLIYLDCDDTPELICGLGGYYVSMYAFKDGEAKLVIDNWPYGAFGNSGYDFHERTGLITNSNSDYAGLVVYLSIMRYDPETLEITDDDDPMLWSSLVPDSNGDGFIDTDEAYAADYDNIDYDKWYYYAGNRQISQEDYEMLYNTCVPKYAEELSNGAAIETDNSYEHIMSVLED